MLSQNPWLYQSLQDLVWHWRSTKSHAFPSPLLIRIIKLKGKAKTYRKVAVHVCLEHPDETQTRRQITTMDLKCFKLLASIKKSREKKTKIKSLLKSYLPQRVDMKKILSPLIGKKRRVPSKERVPSLGKEGSRPLNEDLFIYLLLFVGEIQGDMTSYLAWLCLTSHDTWSSAPSKHPLHPYRAYQIQIRENKNKFWIHEEHIQDTFGTFKFLFTFYRWLLY